MLGLRHQGVETAEQAGLLGRADSDHFAYCWRSGKIMVTHDFDFYNYKNPELPDTRNPGVVVLDCDSGNTEGIEKILDFLPILADLIGERGWRHTRTVVSPSGRVRLRRRNRNSGRYQIEHFRLTSRGFVTDTR
ncbi:MAG: hypothetical protein AB7N65_10445 [Vicinamibacterales bacterium]